MSGLSLLGEFFSAGFRLLLRFMSHPVTIGSLILVSCTLALCSFLCFLGTRFSKYEDILFGLTIAVFLIGFALCIAFLSYGGVADAFLAAWESRWS